MNGRVHFSGGHGVVTLLNASQQETIRDQAASLRTLCAPKKTCTAHAGGTIATKSA